MTRVYVAGPYSGETLDMLENMRRGIAMCVRLLVSGFAPFCPWLDFMYVLCRPEDTEVTVEMLKAYSMAWLDAADVVLVLPGWERSPGTRAEMVRANEKGIAVVFSVDELKEWAEEHK